jgi:hypothetical protein
MTEKTFERDEFIPLFKDAIERSLKFASECLGEPLPKQMEFYLSSINHRIDRDTDSKMIRIPIETILSLDETVGQLLNEKGWFRVGIRVSVFGVTKNSTIVEVDWENGWTNIVPCDQLSSFKETPFIVQSPPVESYNRETNTDFVYYPLCFVEKVEYPSFWRLGKPDFISLKQSELKQRYNAVVNLARKLSNGFTASSELKKWVVELVEQEVDDEIKSYYIWIFTYLEPTETTPLLLQ